MPDACYNPASMSLPTTNEVNAAAGSPLIEPDPAARKRRFKKRCEETKNVYQNWQIRVHRSLSWSLKAAVLGESQPEAELLFHWIAFNSLYGRWNAAKNVPDIDHDSRRDFINHFARLDRPAVAACLLAAKPTLRKLLGSPYLSNVFWKAPEAPKATQVATADLFKLDGMLKGKVDGDHARLLDLAFERVSVLRGQLVHGASSGGSRLNRGVLSACLDWMRTSVPLMQHLSIEHGANDDWPDLCYPPINTGSPGR